MSDEILTEKLRYYARHGNIDIERCVQIAQAANGALVEHSRDGRIPRLATAMVRCCLNNEDEAAYFRCAVDSLLQEKWGATPKDSAVLTTSMDMTYQGIWKAIGHGNEKLDEEDTSIEEDACDWEHISVSPFGDFKVSDSITLDDIEQLTKTHDGLRPQRREAMETMEFEEFVSITDQMDGLRNQQIQGLIDVIQDLQSTSKKSAVTSSEEAKSDPEQLRISGQGIKRPSLKEFAESIIQQEADCKKEKKKSLRRLAVFAVSGILTIGFYYIIRFFI